MIGGGARADLWCDVLASMLNIPLRRIDDASHGPALGAARLARAALTGHSHFARPHATRTFEPRPALVRRYDDAHLRWSALYSLVRQAPGPAPTFNTSDSVS